MCPKGEWLNAMVIPWLADCSSIEMKIANNQHREIASGYEGFLCEKLQNQ